MSDFKTELVKHYHDYIEYLEGRIDEAVESEEYQSLEVFKTDCVNRILPQPVEKGFGHIFRWITFEVPVSRWTLKEMHRDIVLAEERQREIVDSYCPDPSFEGFIDWLSSNPPAGGRTLAKLRAIKDR